MNIPVTATIPEATDVPVLDAAQAREYYEALTSQVMRLGSWLSSPAAQLLPENEWEAQFAFYQQQLEALRRLGDQLRPVFPQDRYEPLRGDALTNDVLKLFAV